MKLTEEVFNALIQKYHNRLYQMLLYRMKRVEDAEDVLQNTLMQAFCKLSSFNGKSSFYTWIYRIARNAAVDYVRRNRRCPPLLVVLDMQSYRYSAIESPQNQCICKEERQRVRHAIRQLPIYLKKTLVLRVIKGIAYEKIAELLSIPIGTVKSRLNRANQLMGDFLATH